MESDLPVQDPGSHLFTINNNTQSLTVMSCKLPTETLSHLMQQINGCNALCVLDLYGTTITGCLSSFLPDPHPDLPELERLHLMDTSLNKEDLQHLTHLIQTQTTWIKLPEH